MIPGSKSIGGNVFIRPIIVDTHIEFEVIFDLRRKCAQAFFRPQLGDPFQQSCGVVAQSIFLPKRNRGLSILQPCSNTRPCPPLRQRTLAQPWTRPAFELVVQANTYAGLESLPDANDFLDANTIFFRQPTSGNATIKPVPLPSRSHAEIVFTFAQLGLHGSVCLPERETEVRKLRQNLALRLTETGEKANHLARSRTNDERKAADLAGLLRHCMIHDKPHKESKKNELP